MAAVWRVGTVWGLAWLSFAFSGCAATMAMHQPGARDLSVLQPGTPRGRVVAELGPPVTSYPSAEGGVDVFAFRQGYTRVNRTARALGHATGTVMTAGVWEIAGIPLESWYSGTDVKLEVLYDVHGRVGGVQVFEGGEAFRGRILSGHVQLAGAGPPPTDAPPATATPPPEYAADATAAFSPTTPSAPAPTANVPIFDAQPPLR
ncbi:MAG: hypothetical protein KY475_10955 [Planctomycetes bacterium]|nr:hypothetical protein [Planctomycetota bacterium]